MTITSTAVLVPLARFVPEPEESETKPGASEASVAVQFNGSPPEFPIVIGRDGVPLGLLNLSAVGLTIRVGTATTLNVTATVCGLPAGGPAASEMEPVYDPAARAAEVTVTVKVVVSLVIVAEAGVTVSQPVPDVILTVGVMVMLPSQFSVTLIVKVLGAGLDPFCVVKGNVATEGGCNVHSGCTVNVTVTVCGVPTVRLVTLSLAATVTVPVYVPAATPLRETPILVAEDAPILTVPVAAVALSHLPPARFVATVAVHFNGWVQAPVAVIFAVCGARGAACPTVPAKVRSVGATATVHGAWTVKVTGMVCGLPGAAFPAPSVPVIVMVPL